MESRGVLSALADLVWPPRCAACSARLPSGSGPTIASSFCPACLDTVVPVEEPYCSRCGLPIEGTGTSHLCGACLASPPAFERARSAYLYGGALADALLRFKYGHHAWLATPLGRLIPFAALQLPRPDIVVPVPLHRRRLVERGYNQSALMAAIVAGSLGARLVTGLLARRLDTPPQTGLGRAERASNLARAFEAVTSERWRGARVLLVDDVITTSATARACSEALRKAGTGEIHVISLARTPDEPLEARFAPHSRNR